MNDEEATRRFVHSLSLAVGYGRDSNYNEAVVLAFLAGRACQSARQHRSLLQDENLRARADELLRSVEGAVTALLSYELRMQREMSNNALDRAHQKATPHG